MKKLILIFLFISSSLFAQGYVTNGFWDNWYVGAGAGVNLGIDKYVENDMVTYPVGVGVGTEMYMGKGLTPDFSIKISKQGWNTSCGSGVENFAYINGSFIWNLSSQFGGYDKDRKLAIDAYLHAGIVQYGMDSNFGLGCGIETPVKLYDQVYAVPNLKFLAVHNVGIDALSSFIISVRYYFEKSYWDKQKESHI